MKVERKKKFIRDFNSFLVQFTAYHAAASVIAYPVSADANLLSAITRSLLWFEWCRLCCR